jgi:hypothetical protein
VRTPRASGAGGARRRPPASRSARSPPDAYDGFQAAARALYQQPAVEIGLVALPLLVHVAAGTALLVLALLAFGGRLFPIADPTQNPYARMWERYGVSLE